MKIKSLLTLLALAFIFVSCSDTLLKRRNIICLVDFSGTITEKTLHNYASVLSKDVLLNIDKYDKFTIMPIDEAAKTEPVFLAHVDLINENFEDSNDGLSKKEILERQRVNEYLKSISDSTYNNIRTQKELRLKYTKYTDIINVLELISTKMEHSEEVASVEQFWNLLVGTKAFQTENILVICSDMLHETKDIAFNDEKVTRTELEDLLLDLKNTRRIPDLTGLSVFVNGRTGLNNETIDKVQFFWNEYFKLTGANLISYEYDSHYSIVDFIRK